MLYECQDEDDVVFWILDGSSLVRAPYFREPTKYIHTVTSFRSWEVFICVIHFSPGGYINATYSEYILSGSTTLIYIYE